MSPHPLLRGQVSGAGLAAGFVLLSDRDTDAPALSGVATVSKEEPWDRGAWQIGVEAAKRGALWVDRPYFTGNPNPLWLIEKCRQITDLGGYCQAGNEQNLGIEEWQGGRDAYAALWHELVSRHPGGNWLYMPPSPGVPDWQSWVRVNGVKRYGVHAYGSFQEMRSVLHWYLENTGGDLYVTECNPGAGNLFDLDAWARDDLVRFLSWCRQRERIKLVAYFAWRWDQSRTLPSSVDGAGTAVEAVLRSWENPTGGNMGLVEQLPVGAPSPDPIVVSPPPLPGGNVVSESELDRYCADIWKRAGVPYTPGSALADYWREQLRAGRYLGRPEEPEHPTENGRYMVQAFAGAILHCEVNVWIVREGLPPLVA